MQSLRNDAGPRVASFILAALAAYSGLVALIMTFLLNFLDGRAGIAAERYDIFFQTLAVHGAATLVFFVLSRIVRRRARIGTVLPKLLLPLSLVALLTSTDRLWCVVFPDPLPSRSVYQLHPRRGWAHIPLATESQGDTHAGTTDIRLDEDGLRVEFEDPAPRPNSPNRLLFLGDSVTFGYYRKASDAYGAVAVARLNEGIDREPFVELNAGVTGYDTGQECDLLLHEGFALAPRLVVLQHCLNDVTEQFDPITDEAGERHEEMDHARPPTHWSGWVRAARRLARVTRFGVDEQAAAKRIEHLRFSELLATPVSAKVEAAWAHSLAQLKRMADACRERSIPLVVVSFPIRRQLARTSESTDPQERLARFCKAEGVPFLDLMPVFLGGRPPSRELAQRLMEDPTHPSLEGHRVAGEALAEFLQKSGIAAAVREGK